MTEDACCLDPILAPLAADQQAPLEIIGDAVMANRRWPMYQYVQAQLNHWTTASRRVLWVSRHPDGPELRTGPSRPDRPEQEPVKLTIAGMADLPLRLHRRMFLRVVRELGTRAPSRLRPEPGHHRRCPRTSAHRRP